MFFRALITRRFFMGNPRVSRRHGGFFVPGKAPVQSATRQYLVPSGRDCADEQPGHCQPDVPFAVKYPGFLRVPFQPLLGRLPVGLHEAGRPGRDIDKKP
jgi:hypothetical protein